MEALKASFLSFKASASSYLERCVLAEQMPTSITRLSSTR